MWPHPQSLTSPAWRGRAAQMLADAFADYPLMRCVYGPPNALPPSRQMNKQRRVFAAVIAAAQRYGHVFGLIQQEEVIGVAVAYGPGQYPPPWPGQWINALGAATIGLRYALRYQAFDSHKSALHPHEPHWYLHTLGVHPCWQGRGVGSALLHHLANLSGRDGVPCYVETARAENVAFYQRGGYIVISQGAVPRLPSLCLWTLMRPH